MVSPTATRKAKEDQVKRIVSKKVNRPDARIGKDLASGLEAIKHRNCQNNTKRVTLPKPGKVTNQEFHSIGAGRLGQCTPIIARGAMDHSQLSQSIPIESNSKVHAYQRDLHSSMGKVGQAFEISTEWSNHTTFAPSAEKSCPASNIDTLLRAQIQRGTEDSGGCAFSPVELVQHSGNTRFNINERLGTSRPQLFEKTKTGSSISARSWNEPHQENILNPADLDVGFIGSSKAKKKRGRTKGHKLAKTLEHGQRFEVIFPGHVNRPVGKYSTIFTTEIGVLVRPIAPLQAVSWGAVSREKKDSIMDRLRDKFEFRNHPDVISSVECTMARRYNTWRYNLHDKFLKYRTVAAALLNPPVGIKGDDWMYLCDLFTTQKFKARSEKNKRNKAKLKTAHTTGTKAYSKIRYDKRNTVTQTELEFTELYEFAHQRSDGTWVHENARIFHESLKEHKSKAESEGNILIDEQLSVLTFGRKPGYLCGLGHGPKPTSSATGKHTHSELEREAYEAAKRAELAEISAREARQETAALSEKLKKIEDNRRNFLQSYEKR